MGKWLMPAIVALTLIGLTDHFGLRAQAWWVIPVGLFPVAVVAMVVRKELTVIAVMKLVILSAVLALILKVGV